MKITVLTGGVGGAKFLAGLQLLGVGANVTAVINTGDDFEHLGLHISPDVDTTLYTLAGLANRQLGWGREGESWAFMDAVKSLGGPDWFNLGDGDLALHVLRTRHLRAGGTLSGFTAQVAANWQVGSKLLPMADDPVRTFCDTDEGALPFQEYFVRRQCAPSIREIRFAGADDAQPAPGVVEAITGADVIFIAPSNPYLSIDPMLAVFGISDALHATSAPVVAISPIVGGKAVKGPTAKLMAELGLEISNQTVGDQYAGLLAGMVHDESDAPPANLPALATATLMKDDDAKRHVADAALKFASTLR